TRSLLLLFRSHSSTIYWIPNLSLSQRRPITVAARLSGNNNNSNTATTPATDRLISALAYTLPFFNSLQYGRFLFAQFPSVSALLLEPILPLLSLYRSLPYASFVAFFGIYLGVVRNKYFSDYARFNAMQALTMDVLLVLPLLLGRIFSPGRSGLIFLFSSSSKKGFFCFLGGIKTLALDPTSIPTPAL
ncbi:Protein TIC 20-II, chloroplastic, partial [Linum perenne]